MFNGFDSHLPNWLAPSLQTATVANLIEQIVLSGKSQVSRLGAVGAEALQRLSAIR
jgi:hypothetical protein